MLPDLVLIRWQYRAQLYNLDKVIVRPIIGNTWRVPVQRAVERDEIPYP